MKSLSLHFLIACSAILTFGQTVSLSGVSVRALTMTNDGAIRHLRGNVEITWGRGFILRSDQADYNSNTGEVAARGNVRMTRQGRPLFPRNRLLTTVKSADEVEVNLRTGEVKARVGKPPQAPR